MNYLQSFTESVVSYFYTSFNPDNCRNYYMKAKGRLTIRRIKKEKEINALKTKIYQALLQENES